LIPAIVIAVLFAWLIARTDMPGGNAIEFFCWMAYFIPDFPLTLAWILLLDPNYGLLNTLALKLPFVHTAPFNPYSFWGIVWVHTSTGGIWFKVILLTPVFRRLSAALEEAARVAGAKTTTVLWRSHRAALVADDFGGLRAELHSRLAVVQHRAFASGQPAGIYVYSTRIYDYIRREPASYGEGDRLSVRFFIVALGILLFLYWRFLRGKRKFTVVTGQGYSTARARLGRWRYVALAGCILYVAIMTLLPLVFLTLGSFMRRYGFFNISSPFTLAHWQDVLSDPIFFLALKNSLLIATITAGIGVVLYSIVAYVLVSRRAVMAPVLEAFCWLPHILPGILLGLGILWLFLATPLRFVFYGTTWGIALALMVSDSPVTTQAFRAGYLQLGADLEEAARVAGASWGYTYRRILLPLLGAHCRCNRLDEFRRRLDQHQHSRVTLQPPIASLGHSHARIQRDRRARTRCRSWLTDHGDDLRDDVARSETWIAVIGAAIKTSVRGGMRPFVILLMALLWSAPILAQSRTSEKEWNTIIEGAKKEGKVVVAGSPDPVMRNEIIPKFKERYGIPIEFIAGRSSEISARIKTERGSGIYSVDVYLSGPDTTATTLYGEKMIDPVKPLLIMPEVADGHEVETRENLVRGSRGTLCRACVQQCCDPAFSSIRIRSSRKRCAAPRTFSIRNGAAKFRRKIRPQPARGPTLRRVFITISAKISSANSYIEQKTVRTRERRQMSDWLARGTQPICLSCREDDVRPLIKEGFKILEIFELA
jgi:iron(III) transport system permease protein